MNQEKISGENNEIFARKKKIFTDIRRLRDEFLDKIPEEILKPDAPNYYRYKCRRNFFATIMNEIFLLKEFNMLKSPEVLQACDEYEKFAKSLRVRQELLRRILPKPIKCWIF